MQDGMQSQAIPARKRTVPSQHTSKCRTYQIQRCKTQLEIGVSSPLIDLIVFILIYLNVYIYSKSDMPDMKLQQT